MPQLTEKTPPPSKGLSTRQIAGLAAVFVILLAGGITGAVVMAKSRDNVTEISMASPTADPTDFTTTIATVVTASGPVIALDEQDQAFVTGLQARGVPATDSDPGLARSACTLERQMLSIGALGKDDQDSNGALAYQGFQSEVAIAHPEPDKKQLFTDSAIATYCPDLTWIEQAHA